MKRHQAITRTYASSESSPVQSSVFGLGQPLKLRSAEGHVDPSGQHSSPPQLVWVPGQSTLDPTTQCAGLGDGGVGGEGGEGGEGLGPGVGGEYGFGQYTVSS
mmetsp:Transcript_18182/g.34131  ORF Transcript_18182/g.34131 Transcript_18182/m.34131 type:complete len:103 (+) Transcript_18182:81-389(+)